MDFIDMNLLIETISNDLRDTILDDVIDVIKETEAEVIEDIIYNGSFQPNYYDRRGDNNGGLGDKENMKASYMSNKNDINIEIINETRGSGDRYDNSTNDYISDIVESGEGYNWSRHPGSRPFTEVTSRRLEDENIIEKEIIRSMKDKGYIID